MMKKSYVQPNFERSFRLNISLDELRELVLSLRDSGYRVAIRTDVYEDLLFTIKGFAGTAFEIKGVAQSLEDDLVEICYNKRYEILKLIYGKFVKRTYILNALLFILFLVGALSFYWALILLGMSMFELGSLVTLLTCISWPSFFYVLIALANTNPYEHIVRKAIMALNKLEETMIRTLVNENPEAILTAIAVQEDKKRKNHES